MGVKFLGIVEHMGEWSRAMMISIDFCGIPFVLYYLLGEGIPTNKVEFMGFITVFLLFISVYLLFSFVGWLTFGILSHWLICKYTNGNVKYYIFAVVLLSCIFCMFVNYNLVLFFGIVALLQALAFKYYINKIET
ncbi:hypothetical protein SOPP22_14250 [Shewanella sp. OPT22]|nr:hypothetical protein SOPP22_14250 [Shewanella sp. OPT22]